jgi:hypothetical protein
MIKPGASNGRQNRRIFFAPAHCPRRKLLAEEVP